jgi:hypothetical protein
MQERGGGSAESGVGDKPAISTFDPWTVSPDDTIDQRTDDQPEHIDYGESLDGFFILC